MAIWHAQVQIWRSKKWKWHSVVWRHVYDRRPDDKTVKKVWRMVAYQWKKLENVFGDGRWEVQSHPTIRDRRLTRIYLKKIQLNPAIAHFKGLVKIMLYIEVFTIANIKITMKMLLGIQICIFYWRKFVISGCVIAGNWKPFDFKSCSWLWRWLHSR